MSPSIEQLLKALRNSWGKDTSYEPGNFTGDNPARGQCVSSSLVIQHYFGGDLLRYYVKSDTVDETHYCNILPDGTILDATGTQYKDPVSLTVSPVNLAGFPDVRTKRLSEDTTREKYEILLNRVQLNLLS